MAKYIALMNWTDQGIKSVKDAPHRVEAARALAKKLGCELKEFYVTIGNYDMVSILEAPTDEAAAKFALAVAGQGNVRTSTLKAFSETDFQKIVSSLP